VPGSIVAYTAFTWLLRNVAITTVSTYAYVNPIVAVTVGWALLGERISAQMAVGGVVIVASVALVIQGRRLGHSQRAGQGDRLPHCGRAVSDRPGRRA
jgi:drug/metabolite transporter (DMT)-like permease